MSIGPFSTPRVPTQPGVPASWWRTRLAVVSATVGIAATLLAYAISPGLRHAVVHAERSVRHAMSRVFDKDSSAHKARHTTRTTPHKPTVTQTRVGSTGGTSATKSGARVTGGSTVKTTTTPRY
jgi:hypothetical protein